MSNEFDNCQKSSKKLIKQSTLVCLENLPIIGYGVSAYYAIKNQRSKAERAAIKSTIGFLFFIFNLPADIIDECIRYRCPQLKTKPFKDYKKRSNWMKNFSNMKLKDLCIPASHDSSTFNCKKRIRKLPMAIGWATCQSLNIEQQLEIGIRFFDLRVVYKYETVWIHHNIEICLKLTDFLKILKKFLIENPTEIVGFHVTEGDLVNQVKWSNCQNDIENEFGDMIFFENEWKKLQIGDLLKFNKRLYPINGIGDEVIRKYCLYSWKGFVHHHPQEIRPVRVAEDLKFYFERYLRIGKPETLFWYKAEATPTALSIIRNFGGIPGSISACNTEKFDFLKGLAEATNFQVIDVLNNNKLGYTNQKIPFHIFSTDFVNDDIIEIILKSNYI